MALHVVFFTILESLREADIDLPGMPLRPMMAAFTIGVVQIPYVTLAWLLLRWTGHPEIARGVVRGALLTLLVNAAGCGALALGLATANF
ncbi:MAG TPA: hypothetical protein VEB59_17170 [Gemmatimonadales bacterium]|nr:hypothetical protein [Gemmatimonadales bacterium]